MSINYRQWKLLTENFGGPISLGIKSPNALGVMGSRLNDMDQKPEDEMGEENPIDDMDDEKPEDEMEEENPIDDMGDENMEDEMGEENPIDDMGMSDDKPEDKEFMDDDFSKEFMDMDFMDDEFGGDKGPVVNPAADEFEADEFDDMADPADNMGEEDVIDDEPGETGDGIDDDMSDLPKDDMPEDDEIPTVEKKPKMMKKMMCTDETSLLNSLISTARKGKRMVREDALVTTKVKKEIPEEPQAGEVGYAPTQRVGAVQSFAEWRKAKEAK